MAAFGPEARLRESSAFRAVFARGRKVVAPGFVIIFAANSGDGARLGLALAKRHIRRAVDRNRIKRVLRESFRQTRAQLGGVDVVVLARSRTSSMSNADLFAQLTGVWSRIARPDVEAKPAGSDDGRVHNR